MGAGALAVLELVVGASLSDRIGGGQPGRAAPRSAAPSGAAAQALARPRAFCYSLPTIGSTAGGVAPPAIGHRSTQRRYGGDAKGPGKRVTGRRMEPKRQD